MFGWGINRQIRDFTKPFYGPEYKDKKPHFQKIEDVLQANDQAVYQASLSRT